MWLIWFADNKMGGRSAPEQEKQKKNPQTRFDVFVAVTTGHCVKAFVFILAAPGRTHTHVNGTLLTAENKTPGTQTTAKDVDKGQAKSNYEVK